MTRQQVSLKPPPSEAKELRAFPRRPLDSRQTLWRVSRKGHRPWWFGSTLESRFDLPEPEGTCYLAADPLSAILEVVGPDRVAGWISPSLLEDRRLHELRVPMEHTLGDLTVRQAAGFGITLEIHSHPDYHLTQAWAKRLREAGTEGLLYRARHDPSGGSSLALFGPSGERSDWPFDEPRRLDRVELTEQLWVQCRIRLVDRPRYNQLSVLD